MKPFDPRLLALARGIRVRLLVTVALCGLTTLLVLAQAAILASLLTRGAGAGSATTVLLLLLAVLVLKALVTGLAELSALSAARETKSKLRMTILLRLLTHGTKSESRSAPGEVATLLTRGLDALDPYFARFLPQLVLGVTVPVAVILVVARADWISALVIAVTVPLIPVFMVLVGLHTRSRTERQWRLLARLGGHFTDVIEGLPTLKIFSRSKAQAEAIRTVTDDYRVATMGTLRTAFLSAFVLELVASLSTAVVAVEVGLRLLHGSIPFGTALFVLIITPEAYAPVRAVGAQFHASLEGASAATEALDLLHASSQPLATVGATPMPELCEVSLRLRGIGLTYSGATAPALVDVCLEILPGERLAVVGPNGAGKSSLMRLLLRLEDPSCGELIAGAVDARTVDPGAWRKQFAWVPQSPILLAGTVAENLRLGNPSADDTTLWQALEAAGAAEFVSLLDSELDTVVGERGMTLSSGQRQRIALARALVKDAPVLLIDEPTAHLDPLSAIELLDGLDRVTLGRTLIVVTHDERCARRADRTVRLELGRVLQQAPLELAVAP